MTETKKTRTPKNAEAITAGALSLSLAEKVALVNKLNDAIRQEVSDLSINAKAAAQKADEAAKLAGM